AAVRAAASTRAEKLHCLVSVPAIVPRPQLRPACAFSAMSTLSPRSADLYEPDRSNSIDSVNHREATMARLRNQNVNGGYRVKFAAVKGAHLSNGFRTEKDA